MRVRRKIIEIDEKLCTGCGQCVVACAEGALQLIDGKARLVSGRPMERGVPSGERLNFGSRDAGCRKTGEPGEVAATAARPPVWS